MQGICRGVLWKASNKKIGHWGCEYNLDWWEFIKSSKNVLSRHFDNKLLFTMPMWISSMEILTIIPCVVLLSEFIVHPYLFGLCQITYSDEMWMWVSSPCLWHVENPYFEGSKVEVCSYQESTWYYWKLWISLKQAYSDDVNLSLINELTVFL